MLLLLVTSCHKVQRTRKHSTRRFNPGCRCYFHSRSLTLTTTLILRGLYHVFCIVNHSFPQVHLLMQVGALEASPQAAEPAGVDKVLTGLEFDELAAVEKTEAVSIMSVFARVEPSHKSRLVELLQAQVQSCV